MFQLSEKPIDPQHLQHKLPTLDENGAYLFFQGHVRNHNQGKTVTHLDYYAYPELAQNIGEQTLNQAKAQFNITQAHCIHRTGSLKIGDIAIWIAVGSHHREAAFSACRYILDTLKENLPIWKKEHYPEAPHQWPNNQNTPPQK